MAKLESGPSLPNMGGLESSSVGNMTEMLGERGLTAEQFKSFGTEYKSLFEGIGQAEGAGNIEGQRLGQMNLARHLSDLSRLNINVRSEKADTVFQHLNEGTKLFTQRDGDLPNLLTYLSHVKNIEGTSFAIPEDAKATALDQYERYVKSSQADPEKLAQLSTGLKYLGLVDTVSPEVQVALAEGHKHAIARYEQTQGQDKVSSARNLVLYEARLGYLGVPTLEDLGGSWMSSIAENVLQPTPDGVVPADQIRLGLVMKKFLGSDMGTKVSQWEDSSKKYSQTLQGREAAAYAADWYQLRQPSPIAPLAVIETHQPSPSAAEKSVPVYVEQYLRATNSLREIYSAKLDEGTKFRANYEIEDSSIEKGTKADQLMSQNHELFRQFVNAAHEILAIENLHDADGKLRQFDQNLLPVKISRRPDPAEVHERYEEVWQDKEALKGRMSKLLTQIESLGFKTYAEYYRKDIKAVEQLFPPQNKGK